MSHVTVYEAMVDPNLTITDRKKQPKNYDYADIPKINTIQRDKQSKEIKDFRGTPIIKIDVDP